MILDLVSDRIVGRMILRSPVHNMASSGEDIVHERTNIFDWLCVHSRSMAEMETDSKAWHALCDQCGLS